MRVLLGLGGMELAQPVLGEHLRDRVRDHLLLEDDRAVEVVAVAGHGREVQALLEEPLRELARAVGAEVEVDRGVLRREPRLRQDDGLHELVGDAARVRGLDGGHRVAGLLPLSLQDRRERPVGPLPALVAVHPVVAAGDGGDAGALGDQLRQVAARRGRRDVAPVGERVDEGALGHPLAPCQLEQRPQVVDVRVDAAVGDEPEQVDVAAALPRPAKRARERRALEERARLDRLVDAHEVLEDHAPGPDRQVADLGVAHLARRQADVLARGAQRRVRVALPERVEDGRVRELDRVPRARRRAAPPVQDDERYERERRAAVRQIAVKESTSREAPPTSAPSTSGWASSSSAFSGLTEPP